MAFFVPLLLTIGGFVLQLLFAPKPKTQFGPRLSDINVPSVSPGNPIVRHWGTMKLSAQLVAVSPLKETKHVKKVGGKGGGSKQKQVTYTYSVDGGLGHLPRADQGRRAHLGEPEADLHQRARQQHG